MELPDRTFCEELLLDIIYYEIYCGHLSSEMRYLFKKHLEQCPSCRHRYLAFLHILQEHQVVRNFG